MFSKIVIGESLDFEEPSGEQHRSKRSRRVALWQCLIENLARLYVLMTVHVFRASSVRLVTRNGERMRGFGLSALTIPLNKGLAQTGLQQCLWLAGGYDEL